MSGKRVKALLTFICIGSLVAMCLLSSGVGAQTSVGVINPAPAWFDDNEYNGSHYYLHTNPEGTSQYLRPECPDLEKTTIENRVKLNAGKKAEFPFAREDWSPLEDTYDDDPDLYPAISLVVNPGTKAGKSLNFEIWFDFDGLAKTEADVDAKALFDPYLILQTNTEVIINLKAKEVQGEMRNFSEDPKEGNIKLVVWRTDQQNESLFIYCGAFKTISWIIVPFSFHRDFVPPVVDGNNESSNRGALIALGAIGLIIVAVVVYYIYSGRKGSGSSGGDVDDDGGTEMSEHERRRRKKERKDRKTKRFYRKNR